MDDESPDPIWDAPEVGGLPREHNQNTQPTRTGEKVAALGYWHGTFYYYSTSTKQVSAFTAPEHTRAHLCGIAAPRYWENAYSIYMSDKGGLSWAAVASDLMDECRAAGPYDPDRVRGRGAWWDRDVGVTVHLGHCLVVDNRTHPLILKRSRYVYEIAPPIIDADHMPEPLTTKEAYWLEKISRMLRWENKHAARLFAGWLVLAPICGALDWRPSIWLTGGSGAGKSWIGNHVIKRVLGKCCIYVGNNTTEPSLRRMLRADALPVVFDEADRDQKGSDDRIQALLGLLRQASAETDAVVAKASPDGGVDIFRPRSMFCFQSINTSLFSQADISRVETLALRDHVVVGDTPFADLQATADERLTEDFGGRLFARTVTLIDQIRHNAAVFSKAIAAMPDKTQRQADQIGALLAGAYSLHGRRFLNLPDATEFVMQDQWLSENSPLQEQRDEYQLLAHLMATNIRVGTMDVQIARLIELANIDEPDQRISGTEARAALSTAGMKLTFHENQIGVAVSTGHPTLKKMLRGTPWAASWARALTRVKGVVGSNEIPVQNYGAGLRTRAVWIPMAALMG